MTEWTTILRDFGWPALIALLAIWANVRVARWAGPRIDDLIQVHKNFLAAIDAKVDGIRAEGIRADNRLSELTAKLSDLTDKVGALLEEVRRR